MFARSWCVRRTSSLVPTPFSSPKRSTRFQQGREARRNLAVQEAVYDLVGLPEAFGEGGEKLHGEIGAALDDLGEGGLLQARHPHVGDGLRENVLPAPLDEGELAEDAAILQQSGRRLLVVAVHLVKPDRSLHQKVELVVGVPRREDGVLGPVAPLDHADPGPLEVFYIETIRCRRSREAPCVVPEHLNILAFSSETPCKNPCRDALPRRGFLQGVSEEKA